MRRFVSAASFDPARLSRTITIAANDLQRDLLLPRLLNLLQAEAPGVSLRVLPSGIPTVEMLRSEECDLVITPRPPDGSDIVQKRL
jgi:DNA-binding transcriptional LysR family regulator